MPIVDSIPAARRGSKTSRNYAEIARLALEADGKPFQLVPGEDGVPANLRNVAKAEDPDAIPLTSFVAGLKRTIANEGLSVRVESRDGTVFLIEGEVVKRTYSRREPASTNAPTASELAEVTPELVAAEDAKVTEAKPKASARKK